MLLLGFSFVDLLKPLQHAPTSMPVTELFYATWFFWLILLLTTPVITMRLFALEKFSGTFETLMTTAVRDGEVVMAKFSAALLFYLVMWLPHIGCIWVVSHYTNSPAALEAGAIGSTFLGIMLLGSLFLSLGCVASALTRSQVIAAMISMAFGLSLFMLAYLADQIPSRTTWQAEVLACFALFEQMRDFARGVVDTRTIVLYGTLTFFFLFLTLRIVE